ncbi:MAG: gamma-glutamylcyclotransferase [Flammeovirgaceae bacterium]|nr:gamma-glutamylcyclotransferase [Flammeovirgaceae bacterium]
MDLATHTFAFYGSLRIGMYNYLRYRNALHYEYSQWLPGYELFSLGDYPAACPANPNQSIIVEFFSINDIETRSSIHDLEIEAGYFYKEINHRHRKVGIYLMNKKANSRIIESGIG